MAEILVVGAGPVGLTMAAELARHGARCRIIDRLAQPLPYCRAIGVTPRTLEVWDAMGIAREMIDAGIWIEGLRSILHGQPPRDARLELPDLPYAQLGLPQYETERLLARHLGRFGITVERGVTLTGLSQDAEGVAVRLEQAGGGPPESAGFRYVVGCDGAHSAVRRALGIGFEGDAFPMMFMLGDVHIGWDLPRGMALRALRLVEGGAPDMFIAIPLPEPGRYRVSMLAPAGLASPGGSDHGIQAELQGPDLPQIQAVADDLLPDRPRLSDLRWSSVFRISMRLAAHYRQGRAFIAGDAAHIHPPTGGQGMNTGIQDACNLAWKLALVLKGAAPESLLDSYEAERRPVGAEVVARTRAASEGYGREAGSKPDRLADTQILVSYRGTGWVRDDAGGAAGPAAGDRAPDAIGLRRHGVGFPPAALRCAAGDGTPPAGASRRGGHPWERGGSRGFRAGGGAASRPPSAGGRDRAGGRPAGMARPCLLP
ncbi:FAD-dependent monooxygenase [Siccirubricoccus sp. G192]|nr:FAD-dependent monooxygenase [Siccirubricoccus sp. G192]MBV1799801.1 FAD-dependent monooxygenase [Siccirubricoccus sp. G192]